MIRARFIVLVGMLAAVTGAAVVPPSANPTTRPATQPASRSAVDLSKPVHWGSSAIANQGPAGTLAASWQPTNPNSFDVNWFGIADGPAAPVHDVATLSDGRAAVAFEQWVKVDMGMELRVMVRAFDGKAWRELGKPIVITPTPNKQPLPFDGRGVVWPENKIFGHGSCHLLWGRRDFWYGGFTVVGKLLLGQTPDGKPTLTIFGGKSMPPAQAWAIIHRLSDDVWQPTILKNLEFQGDNVGVDDLRATCDSAGRLYVYCPRKINDAIEIPIWRYESDQWVDMTYAPGGSVLPGINGPVLARSVQRAVLWTSGKVPLLMVTQKVSNPQPGKPPEKCYYLKWDEESRQWQSVWGAKQLEAAQAFGDPLGQRHDGLPVWLGVKDAKPGQPFTGRLAFIEPRGASFDVQPLPELRAGAYAELPARRASVIWVNNEPTIAAAPTTRVTKIRRDPLTETDILTLAPEQSRLHAVVWRRGGDKWELAGNAPAYTRPFHAEIDGIMSAHAAIDNHGGILLIWNNPMPVRGPKAIFGAYLPPGK